MKLGLKIFYFTAFSLMALSITFLLTAKYCITPYKGNQNVTGDYVLEYNETTCYTFLEYQKEKKELNKKIDRDISQLDKEFVDYDYNFNSSLS